MAALDPSVAIGSASSGWPLKHVVKCGIVFTAFIILFLITFPFLQALPGPYGLHLWYHVNKNHTVAASPAVFDSQYLLIFLACLQELRAKLLTLPWPQLLPLSSGGSLFLMTALKWRQRVKPLFSTFIFADDHGHHFSLPLTHFQPTECSTNGKM